MNLLNKIQPIEFTEGYSYDITTIEGEILTGKLTNIKNADDPKKMKLTFQITDGTNILYLNFEYVESTGGYRIYNDRKFEKQVIDIKPTPTQVRRGRDGRGGSRKRKTARRRRRSRRY